MVWVAVDNPRKSLERYVENTRPVLEEARAKGIDVRDLESEIEQVRYEIDRLCPHCGGSGKVRAKESE